MKNQSLVLALLIVAVLATCAHATFWVQTAQPPAGMFPDGEYYKVQALSETAFVALGSDHQSISDDMFNFRQGYHSADGGVTVTPIFNSDTIAGDFFCKSLLLAHDLYFLNETTGLIFGGWGGVYAGCNAFTKSTNYVANTNDGTTWGPIAMQPSMPNTELWGVGFLNSNVGFAAGAWNNIWSTTNGGGTWTYAAQDVPEFAGDTQSVSVVNENDVFIAAETILPDTWADVDAADDYWGQEKSTPELIGLTGALIATNNGGLSWTVVTTDETVGFRKVQFIDSNTGWLLALNKMNAIVELRYTTDGGATWTAGELPAIEGIGVAGDNYLITDFQMLDADTGWAVGGANTGTGFPVQSFRSVILKTTDGGQTWQADDFVGNGFLLSISMFDGRRGFAVGKRLSVVSFFNPSNDPPDANAGEDQVLARGAIAYLDGANSSDPDGDHLTYDWTFTQAPDQVSFNDATSPTPTFQATSIGTYTVQLVVSDGTAFSAPDTVDIVVTENGTPPDDDWLGDDTASGDDTAGDDTSEQGGGDDDDNSGNGGCCG